LVASAGQRSAHNGRTISGPEPDAFFGSWRWSVTPQRRGLSRLHLIISAQTLDADGLTADASLPDQVIEVHVRVNYARTLKKVAGWGLLMVAGGALNAWGREIYPTALALLNRFVGQ